MSNTASASVGPGLLTISWSSDSTYTTGGVTYNYIGVNVYVDGFALQTSAASSGSMGFSTSGNIGWTVQAQFFKDGASPNSKWITSGSGTASVPSPPPAPPSPAAPTDLTVTDNTSSVELDWSAVSHPSGTTLTYEVQRNGTTIATGLSSPTYTDSSPGATRPITYGIRAKSVGDGTNYSGTTYSAYTSVQTNGTPYAPTLVSPADGSVLDLTGVQRLRWTPGFPTGGDSQSKFDLGLSSDGGTTWTVTTVTSPNSYYDVASGTLTTGSWQWRVRVYGSTGIVGPYSTAGHFTAATPTDDLTVTYPTSNGYVGQQDHVDWSTSDQVSYQVRRVADNNGTADTDTIYYDSGEVAVAGARTASLTFETNNRFEHIQLRVKGSNGLWSAWVDVLVFVSYTPPPTASLFAQPIVVLDGGEPKALIRYYITTPTPGTGVPAATSAVIAGRPVGATDPEWQRSGVSPNGYVDFATPASGVEYACQVTTVAESGATATTDWMR